MDLVAEGGEFDAEFRGHNARTAVGGVTGDADAHGVFLDCLAGLGPSDLTLQAAGRCRSRRLGWCRTVSEIGIEVRNRR